LLLSASTMMLEAWLSTAASITCQGIILTSIQA
jgi:hypothetical protein